MKLLGYADLHVLAIAADGVARNAYQADAYAVAGSEAFAEMSMRRALAAADQVAEIAAKIREARNAS